MKPKPVATTAAGVLVTLTAGLVPVAATARATSSYTLRISGFKSIAAEATLQLRRLRTPE